MQDDSKDSEGSDCGSGCGPGRTVPEMRREPGYKARPVRRVYRVFELPKVQVHKTGYYRCPVPGLRRRRSDRQEECAGKKDLLRLLELSRVQIRFVGPPRGSGVPSMRGALPAREAAKRRLADQG